MKRSRRRRVSNIVGSTPRCWAAWWLSATTVRTMLATSSAGILPSRSADRVAVIKANSSLLSFVTWRIQQWSGGC
jgi:hypothetical protein